MFLGYQNELIAFAAKTKEELENLSMVEFTKIEKTNKAVEMVDGVYYIGKESINLAKQEKIRKYRNYLLETEIDPIVSNPLRWADMSEEEQQMYKDYRHYLLDYTSQSKWWEQNPLTLEEWKNK